MLFQRRQRPVRIADAVDIERQARDPGGLQQELPQFFGSLVVTPVADPDHAFAVALRLGRTEQAHVGRLVPDEHPPAPAPPAVDFRQGLAERQDAVVAFEVEGLDRRRIADRPMVRIVEQQGVAAAGAPPASKLGHQDRVGPFMDDHQVGVFADLGGGLGIAVGGGRQLRIGPTPGLQARLAMVLQQVLEAPGALRLVGLDRMPKGDQLAQHASQEVGVAMVPARGQRMSEIGDLHAAAPVKARTASNSR